MGQNATWIFITLQVVFYFLFDKFNYVNHHIDVLIDLVFQDLELFDFVSCVRHHLALNFLVLIFKYLRELLECLIGCCGLLRLCTTHVVLERFLLRCRNYLVSAAEIHF